jgi:hypothetical protein
LVVSVGIPFREAIFAHPIALINHMNPGSADSFLPVYEQQFAPRLGIRANGFRRIFQHLEQLASPDPLILETGCAREKDNWSGDGQSTILFDQYLSHKGSGNLYSVDIDPRATQYARSATSPRTQIDTSDSVQHLHGLCLRFMASGRVPDLLYLDSLDVNYANPVDSAVHHLKEFCAIYPCLGPKTLVAIDDCPKNLLGWRTPENRYYLLGTIVESGKGKFLIEFLRGIGAVSYFEEYQVGFILGNGATRGS